MVGMKLISKRVDFLHSTAIYLLKVDNLHIQTSEKYHVFGEKLTRSSNRRCKRPTDRLGHALAHCQSPRPGVGCAMVGMKLLSIPVAGLRSTATYMLKEGNLPIQTSKRYHVFVEK